MLCDYLHLSLLSLMTKIYFSLHPVAHYVVLLHIVLRYARCFLTFIWHQRLPLSLTHANSTLY